MANVEDRYIIINIVAISDIHHPFIIVAAVRHRTAARRSRWPTSPRRSSRATRCCSRSGCRARRPRCASPPSRRSAPCALSCPATTLKSSCPGLWERGNHGCLLIHVCFVVCCVDWFLRCWIFTKKVCFLFSKKKTKKRKCIKIKSLLSMIRKTTFTNHTRHVQCIVSCCQRWFADFG